MRAITSGTSEMTSDGDGGGAGNVAMDPLERIERLERLEREPARDHFVDSVIPSLYSFFNRSWSRRRLCLVMGSDSVAMRAPVRKRRSASGCTLVVSRRTTSHKTKGRDPAT